MVTLSTLSLIQNGIFKMIIYNCPDCIRDKSKLTSDDCYRCSVKRVEIEREIHFEETGKRPWMNDNDEDFGYES